MKVLAEVRSALDQVSAQTVNTKPLRPEMHPLAVLSIAEWRTDHDPATCTCFLHVFMRRPWK